MVNELETIWREVIVAYLRYYPDIWLVGRRKSIKNSSYTNQCPGRDSNPAPPNMNPRRVVATPTCSRRSDEGRIWSEKDEVNDKCEYNMLRNIGDPQITLY
jgi:hypothetical protein